MFNIYRVGVVATCSLLFLGWGCVKPAPHDPVSRPAEVFTATSTIEGGSVTTSNADPIRTSPTVSRTFTLEEIEAEGGLKNWFRDLARANVAGKKTLVRIPVNHVFGFGCETPTSYCASTETTGCFGPYLDLLGNTEPIDKSASICSATCDTLDEDRLENEQSCTQEFRNNNCSTLWDVEGYVTAASKVPAVSGEEGGGTCSQGELMYDFNVTKVIKKIQGDFSEDYQFVEYK